MPHPYRDLFQLTGKVALVTGASKGIGEAIARGLAAFGAKVIVSSRKQESVDAVAQAICKEGGEAVGVAAHVGDRDAIRRLVDQVRTRHGGLDILINNAAINPAYGPLLQADEGVFDKIMAVNVKGPLELARLVHPLMTGRGGSIVNISSIAGIRPIPQLGLYSISKAALLHLTKVLAQEWAGDGIRANALCPGLVQTKFSAALWQDDKNLQRSLQAIPLGRMGQPDDMVGLALFLASPASSYCTGAVFTADGGETI